MSTKHGNQKITDKEILEKFSEIDGPFVTTGELADRLPISRTAVNKRLQKLEQKNLIESKNQHQR